VPRQVHSTSKPSTHHIENHTEEFLLQYCTSSCNLTSCISKWTWWW